MRIAIDFDGTLVEHKFPLIGEPVPYAIEAIQQLISKGHDVILWTYRGGSELDDAIEYCKNKGLEFYAVNMNHPDEVYKPESMSRKIDADIYIDDRNLGGLEPWPEFFEHITGEKLDIKIKPEKKGWFKKR